MASKKILLVLDSDRHVFPLIEYLATNAKPFDWKIKIGLLPEARIDEGFHRHAFGDKVEFLEIKKDQDRDTAIRKSDLVIALVNDALLVEIADSCISHRKTLISPTRLTRQMALKKNSAKENNVLILMDCGFSPGLDHIIAKKAIDNIHSKGGKITSFKTYSGAFVSESPEPNPWDFKLTETAAEALGLGKNNNRHLQDGRLQHIPYHRLFERSEEKHIDGAGNIVAIPEGDSLYYKKIYNLAEAHTVVKGKLLRKGIDRLWGLLLKTGMMDPSLKIDMSGERSLEELVDSMLPITSGSLEERFRQYTGADESEIEKLKWLGLFDPNTSVGNLQETSPSAVLQLLLEEKFAMLSTDQDCLVMQHQLSYELRDESQEMVATLVLKGENEKASAIAKVIGIICGAAAKSVLLGTLKTKGIHIPIQREIYEPILNELEDCGIAFRITEKKLQVVG